MKNDTLSSILNPNSDMYLNKSVERSFSDSITYVRLISVLLLRAGSVLIQTGCIPVDNVYTIILHNVLDVSITFFTYGILGQILAFGEESVYGIFGYSKKVFQQFQDLDETVFGFCACLIGTSIITSILAGRVHVLTAFIVTTVYSGIFSPIVMHWIWHDKGWMAKFFCLNNRYSIKDYAGGVAVHFTAGIVAVWGAIILGRRLIRLRDVHQSSVGSESPGLTFIGYVFILSGLIAFNLPTKKYESDHIAEDFLGIIVVNSLFAASSGLIVSILQYATSRKLETYWLLLKSLQASAMGLVVTSSGIDVYSHFITFILAAMGVTLFYFLNLVFDKLSLEDNCNVVPVHLFGGLVSALLPPIFGTKENLGFSVSTRYKINHFFWQISCVCLIFLITTALFLPIFLVLDLCLVLRNESETLNHQRLLNISKNIGIKRTWKRMFTTEEKAFLEPGSENRSLTYLDKFYVEKEQTRRELLKKKALINKYKQQRMSRSKKSSVKPSVPRKTGRLKTTLNEAKDGQSTATDPKKSPESNKSQK